MVLEIHIICPNISNITLLLPIGINTSTGILCVLKCKQLDIKEIFKIILMYFIKIIERSLFSIQDTEGIKLTQKLKLELPHLKRKKFLYSFIQHIIKSLTEILKYNQLDISFYITILY